MSRLDPRKKNSSKAADSDSDDETQSSSAFSRPKSGAVSKSKPNRKNSSDTDQSYEFTKSLHSKVKSNTTADSPAKKPPQRSNSFLDRITSPVKNNSDSETDSSLTRTSSPEPPKTNQKNNSKKNSHANKSEQFSRPHSRLQDPSHSSGTSSTEEFLASDRPAPKNNQVMKKNLSRTNSMSSENRGQQDTDTSDRKNRKSSNNNKAKKNRSLSSSESHSSSESDSSAHNKKKSSYKHDTDDDDSNDDYSRASSAAHVTKVKVEKKPPIDLSKRNKSARTSSSLEKPMNDSMSDSSDTRRSNSLSESITVSQSGKQHRSKNNQKLNQTFDLEMEESSSNEMTDVSPLPTPKVKSSKSTSKLNKPESKEPRRSSMDMSAFYKILNEDINKRMDSVFSIFNEKYSKSSSKSNLKASFDKSIDLNNNNNNNNNNNANDYNGNSSKYSAKINKIDAENQRLYAKLMSTSQKGLNNNKYDFSKPIRLTSSALNRQREQQRIEKENQQILKRLLKVKATKYLVKEEQIKDYEKNFGANGLNISTRANSSQSMPSGFVSSGMLSHNNSIISTKRSGKSTINNSRISSAKLSGNDRLHIANLDTNELLKRAASASRSRPEWVERW